jgi:thioesterase domain-containing protein
LFQERESFLADRKHFQDQYAEIKEQLATSKKDTEVLKAKYEAVKNAGQDDWRKQYEQLLAQYQAVTAVAQLNTPEEHSKAEVGTVIKSV